ncbi:transmembrane protein 255B isoform X3 [Sphaeramia orbicularis]|uniref:transmembrane protein 255B isoform X3 n=1 Tax=Sphaeramia orbicularis TaxID=375764 RepID=UPI0011813A98|nr:transmembrane protein 255B-like isoform X3 [Sphaeramia orbicularis]
MFHSCGNIMTARIQGVKSKAMKKSRATELMVRVRRALWLVLGMLSMSLLVVALGVYTTTRTESLNVTGYTSGVILTAAIVFLSFGVITSFLCLVIDGVCIVLSMDMRPLRAGRCQFYSSGSNYIYENFYMSVSCWSLEESCNLTVRSGTCYCCDLYNCANGGYLSNYYEFVGVQSCEEVFTLYILIWSLTGLNLVVFFMGILTTAVLGSIKNIRSSSPVTESCMSMASSPTAPLLMDANIHTVHQLHPGGSVYFPAAEESAVSQGFPASSVPHTESKPAQFAPLSYSA